MLFDYFRYRSELSIRAFYDNIKNLIESTEEWNSDLAKDKLQKKKISCENYMINGIFATYYQNKIEVKEFTNSKEVKKIIKKFNKLQAK